MNRYQPTLTKYQVFCKHYSFHDSCISVVQPVLELMTFLPQEGHGMTDVHAMSSHIPDIHFNMVHNVKLMSA